LAATKFVMPSSAGLHLEFWASLDKRWIWIFSFIATQSIRVVEAEDVIGLKLQAMCNDTTRSAQERADIERLMARFGKRLDWERINEYYALFGLGEEAKNLRERFDRAD
jgi:hypothetical protein